jgi:hypothetical protein
LLRALGGDRFPPSIVLVPDAATAMTGASKPSHGCERNRIGYIFGLAGNKLLLSKVADLAEDVAVRRATGEAEKVHRHGEIDYAARSWPSQPAHHPRCVIARVEASPRPPW